jgi:hypothetical protein
MLRVRAVEFPSIKNMPRRMNRPISTGIAQMPLPNMAGGSNSGASAGSTKKRRIRFVGFIS